MMDLGLYQLKYPFRKLLKGLLPFFKNTNPNWLSMALLPIGLTTAYLIYAAETSSTSLLNLAAIVLCLLRMVVGTLDGFIAVHFHKQTPTGELLNRLIPEVCDCLYLTAIAFANPAWRELGTVAIVVSWLTSVSGFLGLLVGKPVQSVGPVGQTDRLLALQIFLLLATFEKILGWDTDFIRIFLFWCIGGGTITIALRLYRNFSGSALR